MVNLRSYTAPLSALFLAIIATVVYARYVMLRMLDVVPNPKSYEVDLTFVIVLYGIVTFALTSGLAWILARLSELQAHLEQTRSAMTEVETKIAYESKLNQLAVEIAGIREKLSRE
jgi:hypothetical protein